MTEKMISRPLGSAELYCDRCHDHNNMNVMLALTIHTRAPLDIGKNMLSKPNVTQLNSTQPKATVKATSLG